MGFVNRYSYQISANRQFFFKEFSNTQFVKFLRQRNYYWEGLLGTVNHLVNGICEFSIIPCKHINCLIIFEIEILWTFWHQLQMFHLEFSKKKLFLYAWNNSCKANIHGFKTPSATFHLILHAIIIANGLAARIYQFHRE